MVTNSHEKLVHPQPSFLPISDHTIVSAPVKLIGIFSGNRRFRGEVGVETSRRKVSCERCDSSSLAAPENVHSQLRRDVIYIYYM